jgi:hypothetical protein
MGGGRGTESICRERKLWPKHHLGCAIEAELRHSKFLHDKSGSQSDEQRWPNEEFTERGKTSVVLDNRERIRLEIPSGKLMP